MEMYKKPVMEILELEKVDVLTCSANCQDGNCGHQDHANCVEGQCY